MAITINKAVFEAQAKKVKEQKQQRSRNTNILSFEIGNTYRLRLLYYTDEAAGITSPFLKSYYHSYREDEQSQWSSVTCPTTFDPTNGFKDCCICKNNSELYKTGVPSDYEIYKKFKRKFFGYCLVWVVSDPTTPANNNTVKIFRYGDDIDKYLNKQIFNIDPPVRKNKNKDKKAETSATAAIVNNNDDIVGFDAFKLEDGYDMIIEVNQKGDWPDYACSFARKPTTINVDLSKLEAETKTLGFEKILSKSSPEAIEAFFKQNVLGIAANASAETTNAAVEASKPVETPAKVDPVSKSIIDDMTETSSDSAPVTAPVEKAPVTPTPAPAPKAPEKSAADIDVDAMLKEMEEQGLMENK